MTFNYSKLNGRITEKYGTQVAFAKAMRISNATMSIKLNNKSAFTQDEIVRAAELLDISFSDISAYFFVPNS